MPNKLIHARSPYLLQHAHNPVNWYPWGEEALKKAREEDKPIFLSVGYAACHWCHVMAHESFEDEETAALMNERFVNIKVDREERPDIDSIYMQAAVAMTGSGGWPLSVFLTPDLKPFYAGTYFPPVRRYNMPAFREALEALANAWQTERENIETVGGRVLAHLQSLRKTEESAPLPAAYYSAAAEELVKEYDWGYGGWGAAPKFPQPMAIEFLLARAFFAAPNARQALESQPIKAAFHALKAMSRGGMYDVVGGGFARYSTDNFWRVPHFEKMLYDNALLLRAYLHAWSLSGDPQFKQVAEETLEFIEREMTHPLGGFYSSLDADSEGAEGKFYVWTLEEIRAELAEESELFETAYGITARGNWEGKTVLQRALDDASLAARFKLTVEETRARLKESRRKLLAARGRRVRPATDDKILTAWNGLALAAVAEAARILVDGDLFGVLKVSGALVNEKYYKMATRNANFLIDNLRPENRLRRSWRAGASVSEVFLEDYAALILGLLELYQTDFHLRWFAVARELTDEMIDLFRDPQGGFFDTPRDADEQLLFRPKDLQDNATPCGNSLACEALLKMAELTGEGRYRDLAEGALSAASNFLLRAPLAFTRWLLAGDFASEKAKQVAILGNAGEEKFEALIQAARAGFHPNRIVVASAFPPPEESPALLKNRPLLEGRATAYVCEGFVCQKPTRDEDELIKQLDLEDANG